MRVVIVRKLRAVDVGHPARPKEPVVGHAAQPARVPRHPPLDVPIPCIGARSVREGYKLGLEFKGLKFRTALSLRLSSNNVRGGKEVACISSSSPHTLLI